MGLLDYTVFLGKDFIGRSGPRRWFSFMEWEGGEDWEVILFRRWLMVISKKRENHDEGTRCGKGHSGNPGNERADLLANQGLEGAAKAA